MSKSFDDVIATCRRSYRDDLAADLEAVADYEVTQFGVTTDWHDLPHRSGEAAYALAAAFRAGLHLPAPDCPPAGPGGEDDG